MKIYTIDFAKSALLSIEDIKNYISISLKAPDTAETFINTLYNGIASLSSFPNRFPLANDSIALRNGLRKMPVGNYIVYYQIFEDSCQVEIAAVIYCRRDQKKALKGLSPE